LENHARINEHMQNLMNTMATSIKSMEKSLKITVGLPMVVYRLKLELGISLPSPRLLLSK
jgi:hypothetical protein